MGYSQEAGYTPTTIATIMESFRVFINVQFGATYTTENFVGSNMYKYFYAQAQKIQEGEIKTSEIFSKVQQYFIDTNQKILRPVVTPPGVIDALTAAGYVASVKPMIAADAGLAHVCVDANDGEHAKGSFTITSFANLVSGTDDSVTVGATVFTAQVGAVTPGGATFQAATSNNATAISLAAQINAHATAGALVRATANGAKVLIRALHGGTDGNSIALDYTDNDANVGATKSGTALTGGTTEATYAATKLAVCTLLKSFIALGIVTVGLESESITLTNGQSFDWKYTLPAKQEPLLRLTTVLSINNRVVILSPEEVKAILLANIAANYQLGRNFEPQRYFSLLDAPWASNVLLEYSLDGGTTYSSSVFAAAFDDLFVCLLSNVTLVET